MEGGGGKTQRFSCGGKGRRSTSWTRTVEGRSKGREEYEGKRAWTLRRTKNEKRKRSKTNPDIGKERASHKRMQSKESQQDGEVEIAIQKEGAERSKKQTGRKHRSNRGLNLHASAKPAPRCVRPSPRTAPSTVSTSSTSSWTASTPKSPASTTGVVGSMAIGQRC